MKGEHLEHPHHHHHHPPPPSAKHEPNPSTATTTNMFSKLHPHSHHLPFPSSHHHQPLHHHFPLCRDDETQTHDHDHRSPAAVSTPPPPPPQPQSSSKNKSSAEPNSASDGATIEVVRRPRGRPPGSKNKPKPPIIITRDPSDPPMSPYILEVPGGCDVLDSISRFCRRKNIGLCILTGSGTVANVTLRQPSTTPGATITFHGRFDILSVSATFFPHHTAAAPPVPNSFSISLAGPQGQIVGGIVAGSLVAAGTVFIIGATFDSPSFHRLPGAEDQEGRSSGSGGGGVGETGTSPAVSGAGGGGDSGQHATPGGGGGDSSGGDGGMQPVYSEAMWPPNCRQQQPSLSRPAGGGNEIIWSEMTPPSPPRGRHEMIWPPAPPPPNCRAGPRSPARSEMMWPPNGRPPPSRSPPPPPPY